MATDSTFTPQILGETEKALNAILLKELAMTGLTEHQWIALRLTMTGGGEIARPQLVGRLAGALKAGADEAENRVDELVTAGLLRSSDDGGVAATEAGAHAHARVRGTVGEITHRLWGDLPAHELEITGRTLTTILARANAHYDAA
jgi:hypothetical protein